MGSRPLSPLRLPRSLPAGACSSQRAPPDRPVGWRPRSPDPRPSTLDPLTEAQISFLWEGQRLPPECLVTRRGETLHVVYRGRPSAGPGPDFRDAVLSTAASELLRGDVEVHLRASGFRHHGHHRDPRYDNLIVHLVWEDDEGEDTLLSCGRRAPVVALAPWVGRRARDLARWLSQPALWEEPCLRAVDRLGAEAVARTLDRLGDIRFRQKQEALRRALEAKGGDSSFEPRTSNLEERAEQVLWQALMAALGQRDHAEAFASLAEALPIKEIRAPSRQPRSDPEQEALRYRELLLGEFDRRPVPLPVWGPRRPAADPRRRLAGAAHLLARCHREGLVTCALRWLTETETHRRPASLEAWMARVEGKAAPSGLSPSGQSLIGRGRALELAANAVLPFLAALGQRLGQPVLEARALALYRRLPEPEAYGATAFLERALRSADGRGLARGVRRRQGLLYLFKGYCTQGGCGRCPLS